jgi:protein-S-isoprenylcysteine O-methyltransferase Ste14
MKYFSIILLNVLILGISISLSVLSVNIDSIIGISSSGSYFMQLVGIGIIVIGLAFRLIASLYFYKQKISILTLKAQEALVTSGIYSLSRNPLYIGIILIFLGVIVTMGSITGIFLWIVSALFCDWWVRSKEEKYMEKAFPVEFKNYKKKTPRWI